MQWTQRGWSKNICQETTQLLQSYPGALGFQLKNPILGKWNCCRRSFLASPVRLEGKAFTRTNLQKSRLFQSWYWTAAFYLCLCPSQNLVLTATFKMLQLQANMHWGSLVESWGKEDGMGGSFRCCGLFAIWAQCWEPGKLSACSSGDHSYHLIALLACLLHGSGGKHNLGNADRMEGEWRLQQPEKQQH